jgi:hypothetical protein
MRLESDANRVLTAELLGNIIVPEALPKESCRRCAGSGSILDRPCEQCTGSGKQPIDPAFFPPIERPMQERYEWWKQHGILKDPDDRYPFYYAIAKQLQPIIIAEIGVFYGYSLMCMAKGAIAGGVRNVPGENVTVNGFDNEQYAPGCLEWARQGFMLDRIACNLMKMDTQAQQALPLSMVQLSSIDGDHSYESAMHDLRLMEPCMVPRPRLDAVHIVDDIGWALSVRQAAEDFAREFGYRIMYLPTHKGTAVLERV